ncbi:MAG: LysM peptidoglycan-binding domain-containing protein [Chloroflexi bacterium]|nr:LysM peptidoglycan-binding domain-containing protein [Chloroflexota bacterium]MBU1749827.1 LysM peptidoglycan-binding domain-containing protein [Chloroflexota bacterium]MBU1879938.1 LysM peptidoglycan-binding domain-containing protein [Chloroflexota bacterium]
MSQDQFFAEERRGLKESALGLLTGLGLMAIVLITIASAVLLLYSEHPDGFAVSQSASPTPVTPSPQVVTATPSPTPIATGEPTFAPAPTATWWGWPTSTVIWPTAGPWPPTYAVPTYRPCSPPPRPYWVYVIQRGDTLSGLAVRYGTSVGTLMQINCLSVSQIYVGQRLYIPGYPPPTPIVPTWAPTGTPVWITATPSPTPGTPSPTGTPGTPSPTAGTPTVTPETPLPTTEPPTATPGTPAPTVELPTATPVTPEPTAEPTAPLPTEPPPTQPPTQPPTAPPTQPPPTEPPTAPPPTATP